MKLLAITALWAIHAATASGSEPSTGASATGQELERITQSLLDAVGTGDTAVWERYLAETCVFVTEDGRVMTRDELLAELSPLPAGYEGRLRVANPVVREHGDTAVISYDAMETLTIYGQRIDTRYRTTDTYVRRNGKWRMIASHVTVLPGDPSPVAIDPAALDRYVGRYEIAPGVAYEVTRDGDRLFIRRGEDEPMELLALGDTRFFRKGLRGEIVFVVGADGTANELIHRRDHNDIVWTRVK